MRWWSSAFCAVILASSFAVALPAANIDNATSVTAAVSASVLGAGEAALALRDLAVLTLRDSGISAHGVPSPPACERADDPACLKTVLSSLSSGIVSAALVNVPAENSPAAWLLRETGIQELDEAAPASRRVCLATHPPARSLLDLTNPDIAANYHLSYEDIKKSLQDHGVDGLETFVPEWCKADNVSCSTVLTSSSGELRILSNVITTHHLYTTIRSLKDKLANVIQELETRPIIACNWAPEFTPLSDLTARTLGPPPCLPFEECPFETRRLVKFVNMRELARAPSALHALVRLKLTAKELRELTEDARNKGHEEAARIFYKTKPISTRLGEVRVAVLLPNATSREAFDARALAAAAALAEDDLGRLRPPGTARFKVEVYDDGCHTARAYKYLNDALATSEFGALSALAGPACGAAWSDLARHSAIYALPMLAFTPQSPAAGATGTAVAPSGTDTRLQLLAAGDAREASLAVAALLVQMGWRRLAVLSEQATRPLVEVARAHAEFAVHVELPVDGLDVDDELISHWVSRVKEDNAQIIYLCVEDARVARAALCAAHHAGVSPQNGAVWLLCSTPQARWLNAPPNYNCTTEELEEVAAGYITVTSELETTWEKEAINASAERRAWEARWRLHCRHLMPYGITGACDTSAPGPHAGVLYDLLLLWAGALDRLLADHPSAIDDLHNILHVSSLIEDATTADFTGLTGRFTWSPTNGALARRVALVLSQWDPKEGIRDLGRWENGSLNLEKEKLKWHTSDGRIPDDGSEYCALQGLADALNTDCRSAFAALGGLLVAILVAVLAAVAFYCKKRTEKEYRKRLAALGMRPLLNKPIGLDRWEVPRERVVINRKLGTGAFGTVYGGHALLAEDRGWTAVAVKTLKAGATTEEKLDFLSEAEAMKRFDHKNVVRLLGVVTKTEPVCTVMEFMLYGDLKNYLLARRHLATGGGLDDDAGMGESDEASPRRLTGMALDVSRALSYLAQLRYVHRDVAARNCLVSARRVVKLADFGMTRLVFENDYYRFSRKGMLPVRWMAPESLALGVFSPASDVWSFGVLLYEIVTFGSLPFQGLSNAEVLARVKAGHTLDLPLGLKPQLEGLIKSCWQQDSKSRPTASEIAAFLADAPRLLAPCLDVPLDALPLDADPPWRLPRDQAEARWVSWAAPASAATDTTYLSTDGANPLDTDSFLP